MQFGRDYALKVSLVVTLSCLKRIAKMANDHFFAPICNKEKRYGSGKDISYFHFLCGKQRRKRALSLGYILVPSSLVSNPKWRLLDKGLSYKVFSLT